VLQKLNIITLYVVFNIASNYILNTNLQTQQISLSIWISSL